jgi:CRP-like cAMP-binding protein
MTVEILRVIKDNHLFAGLNGELLHEIAASASKKTLGSGQILFRKGDRANALWGVVSGRIVTQVTADDGKELVLDVYDAGDVFGEVGVLDFGPRPVDAVAETRTELFRLERRQFLKHLHSSPELCFRIFSLLCNELRESTAALEDTAYRSVGSPWTGDTQVDIPSCPQVDVPSSTQNANERRPKRIERRSSERMVCVNQGVGVRTKSPMLIVPLIGLRLPWPLLRGTPSA